MKSLPNSSDRCQCLSSSSTSQNIVFWTNIQQTWYELESENFFTVLTDYRNYICCILLQIKGNEMAMMTFWCYLVWIATGHTVFELEQLRKCDADRLIILYHDYCRHQCKVNIHLIFHSLIKPIFKQTYPSEYNLLLQGTCEHPKFIHYIIWLCLWLRFCWDLNIRYSNYTEHTKIYDIKL